MLFNQKGDVIDYRNRSQRRKSIHPHHNIFTKQYHNKRSVIRSLKYYKEIIIG